MISVVVLTKNNQKTIKRALDSVLSFSEIVIIDTGSEDETISMAKSYSNTHIVSKPFIGFGQLRNFGASIASNDWILALDSDEELSPELILEIQSLHLQKDNIYSIPFKNHYNGKWITHSGWHPERHVRLYNRRATAFKEQFVHEGLNTESLSAVYLKNYIHHYPYDSIDDFLKKMQVYSSLFAKEHQHRKKTSPFNAVGHAVFAFCKSYFIKRGIFGGKEGFLISIYNANTALYKYLKLEELNKEP